MIHKQHTLFFLDAVPECFIFFLSGSPFLCSLLFRRNWLSTVDLTAAVNGDISINRLTMRWSSKAKAGEKENGGMLWTGSWKMFIFKRSNNIDKSCRFIWNAFCFRWGFATLRESSPKLAKSVQRASLRPLSLRCFVLVFYYYYGCLKPLHGPVHIHWVVISCPIILCHLLISGGGWYSPNKCSQCGSTPRWTLKKCWGKTWFIIVGITQSGFHLGVHTWLISTVIKRTASLCALEI